MSNRKTQMATRAMMTLLAMIISSVTGSVAWAQSTVTIATGDTTVTITVDGNNVNIQGIVNDATSKIATSAKKSKDDIKAIGTSVGNNVSVTWSENMKPAIDSMKAATYALVQQFIGPNGENVNDVMATLTNLVDSIATNFKTAADKVTAQSIKVQQQTAAKAQAVASQQTQTTNQQVKQFTQQQADSLKTYLYQAVQDINSFIDALKADTEAKDGTK